MPKNLLGAFIRAHRERLSPPEHGGKRRRTPGWRREELADAAGLGVTWITWLEQGRDVTPSLAALSRLAIALQLSAAERRSLFDLAGKRDPDTPMDLADTLDPHLLALPHHVRGPAYLLDAGWTALSWNADAASLFVGWLDADSTERNVLLYTFLSPSARSLIVDWDHRARRLAAEFHADFNRRPTDPRLQDLANELTGKSRYFARFWQNQDVLLREGGERQFQHPIHGLLSFHQTTLLVAQATDMKLVCLSALP